MRNLFGGDGVFGTQFYGFMFNRDFTIFAQSFGKDQPETQSPAIALYTNTHV